MEQDLKSNGVAPVKREWWLVTALPHPHLNEHINVGIVYITASGKRKFIQGDYRAKLRALSATSATFEAVKSEIEALARAIAQERAIVGSPHLSHSRHETLVDPACEHWPALLLDEYVQNPPHDLDGVLDG